MNRRIWSTEEKTPIVLEMVKGGNRRPSPTSPELYRCPLPLAATGHNEQTRKPTQRSPLSLAWRRNRPPIT